MGIEKESLILPTTNENNENENNEEELSILTLPPKMQRFVQLYMTGQYSLNKLAQLLELHPNTLGKWLRRKDVQDIVVDMQKRTHEMVSTKLNILTINAVDKLADLIKSPIDGVALQAVSTVLDRCGHRPKQEIKIDKTVTTYEQKLQDVIEKTIDLSMDNYEVEE